MECAKISFSSDYLEGCHPEVLQRLTETNLLQTKGYGFDEFCDSARRKIQTACACPKAKVDFLVGGTQTNATVIKALLRPYQAVISAETGHINGHEAGAIEATGHKVITLPAKHGKLQADKVEAYLEKFHSDENKAHSPQPAMLYISQPTEYGTIYSLDELKTLSALCKKHSLYLYVDGARLAYALASPENTITLSDLAKYCDAFYIGGTKCGLLFGEAVVFPDPEVVPHFFTLVKQQGALLAKGRLLGLQFNTLFTNDLYNRVGKNAIEMATRLRQGLVAKKARFFLETPTNQIFIVVPNSKLKAISAIADYGFWEQFDAEHTVIRFATSWATKQSDVDFLLENLDLS